MVYDLIHKISNPYDFDEIEKLSNKTLAKREKLLDNDYFLSIGRLHPQKTFLF